MDFIFDWEGDVDRFSFEDSDRFEEDSLCSWISEPESLCNNWRGWRNCKQQSGGSAQLSATTSRDSDTDGLQVSPLVELAAQAVACHIPFEVVEHFYPPIPEQLQLRIAFWSFPENEEDIRLYSCLANGSADEFQKGDHLYRARTVKDVLQIGFHLSATVVPPQTLSQGKGSFEVAIIFDRRRITLCNCTCNSNATWCAHIVALCLYRIHQATTVALRAPVSESLSRLHRDQLQKFAQYLISALPQQILPTAQRLLDELLSSQQTAINTVCGAPDPTAGPSASEMTAWCLDETTLHENIKKTLIKFCVPSPIVFSDVNYLSSTAPPAAAEWQSLLRPLRGREPEGIWNLLSIVREMFRRNDSNAIKLLEILTEEVLACEQILIWWFNTQITSHGNVGHSNRGNQAGMSSSQNAASSLCDEIMTLWHLAALNPSLSPMQRDDLCAQLKDWHIVTIDKVRKARNTTMTGGAVIAVKKNDVEAFVGFKPAIEACQLDWSDYTISGITYVERTRPFWRFPFMKTTQEGGGTTGGSEGTRSRSSRTKGVVTSQLGCGLGKMHCTPPGGTAMMPPSGIVTITQESNNVSSQLAELDRTCSVQTDGAYSSSSEGFCEIDKCDMLANDMHDSDSDIADIGGATYSSNILAASRNGQSPGADAAAPAGVATDKDLMAGAIGAVANITLTEADVQPSTSKDEKLDTLAQSKTGCQGNKDATLRGETASVTEAAVAAAVAAAAAATAESQTSGDEYQVYFYDTKAKVADTTAQDKRKKEEPNYFAGIKKMENKQDILFARAEALHAHGHTKDACRLAKQLAEEMLANPPDLASDQTTFVSVGKGRKKKTQNSISSFASTTLAKAAFLCTVLLEDPECHHLAFRVGMFGLEMPRPPAMSKALEVKLAYQESEMVTLLKRIPLGTSELNVIRDRAEKLRDGKLKCRGEALLPLTLSSFIFDSLCPPATASGAGKSSSRASQMSPTTMADEKLGFEACVAALGLKANVSEAEHPLLCEGTRRQRGDLAMAMLVHYKDNQVKLSKVMDKLLDKGVHQLFKSPSLTTYLSGSKSSHCPKGAPAVAGAAASPASATTPPRQSTLSPPVVTLGGLSTAGGGGGMSSVKEDPTTGPSEMFPGEGVQPAPRPTDVKTWEERAAQNLEYLNLEQKFPTASGGGARPKTTCIASKDTDSSAVEEETEGGADYKAWEAKFRCTNLKNIKKHSVGMASIDSSAPETTSSDNSPTMVRRSWSLNGGATKHQGPGSDSGSSGKSSDSLGSSSSGEKRAAAKARDTDSPSAGIYGDLRFAPQLIMYSSRSSTPNMKGSRYKGKTRIMPTVPNQPSEASAHFMFELAKMVLTKAGGSSSTSLFTQPPTNNNPTGPHRALHLCAFQVGLYALGLHNCVSPNWLSRTYSSHVSWITGQAMEIGSAAINILIDSWEGHLTPQEVASLADRASRGRDPNMVRAAAELALSCLPHAQALNPNEIQRALIQCKEQSQEMLEKACLAVESSAKGGNVYPEVLFDVAKRWYELYEESIQGPNASHESATEAIPQQGAAIVVAPSMPGQMILETENAAIMHFVPAQQMAGQTVAAVAVAPAVAVASPHGNATNQLPPGAIAVGALPYAIPPPTGQPHLSHHPYIAPYSYVQQIPPNFAHHYSAPHIPLHTHNIHPSYLSTYPYQQTQAGPAPFANVAHLSSAPLYHTGVSHFHPTLPTGVQVANYVASPLHNHAKFGGGQPGDPPAQLAVMATPSSTATNPAAQHLSLSVPVHNMTQINYLLSTYRVGMLAMETLGRRVHDDRPQLKYARNPPYGEDVKWLLGVALKLGASHLQQFCVTAVNAVVSPFVLHDLAVEAAMCLARNNSAQMQQQLRSPTLSPLMQRCVQMFVQCTHQRMNHITPAEYDEIVNIICSARNAFYMTPGGLVQFNELLQSLRRTKSCKKDLWQRIVNGLASGSV